MEIKQTFFDVVHLLAPKIYEDNRGFFSESYSKKSFFELGIVGDFILEGHSFSKQKNTVRGLHYQLPPSEQDILVRVVCGAVMDVLVDVRKNQPTFGQHIITELSEENKHQLYIPAGFAHGFLTLTDNVHMIYKMTKYYSPVHDRTILWNDPEISIPWNIENPIMSAKDESAVQLSQADVFV